MANPSEGWVAVARVLKTQGRRGELAAEILSDVPGRFAQLREISLLHPSGRRHSAPLLGHWFHKGGVVLRLGGIEDIASAAAWIGAEVQVPRAERPPAPAGQFFVSDLVGCEVTDQARPLGAITAVEPVPGAPALLHVGAYLVPFVQEYIVRLDLPARRLELRLPPGLLDLNPLGRS